MAMQQNYAPGSQSASPAYYSETAPQAQYGETTPQAQYGGTAPQAQYGENAPQVQYGENASQAQYGGTAPQAQYGGAASQAQYGQYGAGNPADSSTAQTTTTPGASNVQGQSTGTAGQGPDFICKILDKLERKFGGARFNDPANEAKNLAMNQKMSQRIKSIAPMVIKKIPMLIGSIMR